MIDLNYMAFVAETIIICTVHTIEFCKQEFSPNRKWGSTPGCASSFLVVRSNDCCVVLVLKWNCSGN